MVPCPTCGTHVRARDRACFACGAARPAAPRTSAVALLLGLSVACVGGTTTDDKVSDSDTDGPTDTYTSPDYGVAYTDYGDSDTDSDSDSDTDTDADTDPPAHSGHSGGHSSAH